MVGIMEILKLFLLSLTILNAQDNSLRILDSKEIDKVTTLINKELVSTSLSQERRYTLLLNLADDLRQFRYLDQATIYYEQAIATNTKENKFNAYIGLINISIQKEDSKKTLELISQAKDYLKANKKFNNESSLKFLNGIAYGFDESVKEKPMPFLSTFAIDEKVKTLIKAKKYNEALAYFKPDSLKTSEDQLNVITYDLLNLKVNSNADKTLYCQRAYEVRPTAYTYSAILCGLLKSKQTGTPSAQSLQRARTYFSEDNKAHAYLFDLYKEIK